MPRRQAVDRHSAGRSVGPRRPAVRTQSGVKLWRCSHLAGDCVVVVQPVHNRSVLPPSFERESRSVAAVADAAEEDAAFELDGMESVARRRRRRRRHRRRRRRRGGPLQRNEILDVCPSLMCSTIIDHIRPPYRSTALVFFRPHFFIPPTLCIIRIIYLVICSYIHYNSSGSKYETVRKIYLKKKHQNSAPKPHPLKLRQATIRCSSTFRPTRYGKRISALCSSNNTNGDE